MAVTALIMAGGKGQRLKIDKEKPLLKIGGKTLVERVIEAAKSAKNVDEIIVAISKNTPKTTEFVQSLRVKTIETPGDDYCSDLDYLIKNYKFEIILTITADLPFLTGKFIDEVIFFYNSCKTQALNVVMPLEIFQSIGVKPTSMLIYNGIKVVPVGINIVDGRIVGKQKEDFFVVRNIELVFNINTFEDLEIAERFLKRR